MTSFNAGSVEATLDLDVDPFQRALAMARRQGVEFGRETFTATVDLDTKTARASLDRLTADLDRFGARRDAASLEVDGVAQSLASLRTLQAAADDWGHTRATASLNVSGTAESITEIGAVKAALDSFGHSGATASIGADTGGFDAGISGAVSGVQALIALGALIAPALVPGLAAAAAAAAGLGVALGGALGGGAVFGAGIVGNVMSIVKAHQTVAQGATQVASTTQAAAAANLAEASAAHQVQTAEQSLSDARRNAAQSDAAAAYQVKEAQYGVTQAQLALNAAIKAATQNVADYRLQLRGQRLDTEGAELAVRDAALQLAQAQANPMSTQLQIDEAQHALDEANFQLDETKKKGDRLRSQAKIDLANGAMGSQQVLQAQHALAEAEHAVTAAQQAAANAQRSGAEQVASAQYALAQAHQAVATAATQSQTASAAAAVQQSAYDKALATISTPAAQAFLAALDDVKDAWHEFTAGTQGPGLAVVDEFLQLASDVLPKLVEPANAVAGSVGGLLDDMDRWVQSGGADRMITWLTTNGPQFITQFGGIIGDALGLLNHLGRAFTPFAHELLDGIDGWLDGLRHASKGLQQNPEFQSFIAYVTENGPKFLSVLGQLGDLFITIGKGLAPLGGPVLDALDAVLTTINGLSPTEVDLLLAAVGAIVALSIAPVAGTAIAVVGLAAALSQFHTSGAQTNDTLTSLTGMFEQTWGWVKKIADEWWTNFAPALDKIRPDLKKLGDVISSDVEPAWRNFWDTFGPALEWLAAQSGANAAFTLELIAKALPEMAKGFAGVLNIVSGTFSGDWDRVWLGLSQTPVGYIGDMAVSLKGKVVDLKNNILDELVRGPDSLSAHLRTGFQTMIDGITTIWSDLEKAAGTPAKFVVDYVWNDGLLKVINEIPGVKDLAPVDTSSWPSFAAGGVLPGHSPGRDVHTFVSPTGGGLRLGGGEGILTTRAVDQIGGAAGLAKLEEMARNGALAALIGMRSHATGGVVYIDGEPMTRVAAAQLAVAERASGINSTVIQGSYQPYSDYSGSSHEGGGVFDSTPGDFTWQGWLRKLAFAAWGRNFPGAAAAGSGAHVHSVSLIDPTVTNQAQLADYRAGQNGLDGGPDYGPRPPVDPALVAQAVTLAHGAGALTVDAGIGGNPFAKFLAAAEDAKAFAEKVPALLKQLSGMGPWAGDVGAGARWGGNKAVGWVNDKIPGPGPFPAHVFDGGGWMAPGWAVNASQSPEAVLTEPQWRALASLASSAGLSVSQGMSRTDVDRLVKAIEDNRGVYAAVSSKADVQAALEALGQELRRP